MQYKAASTLDNITTQTLKGTASALKNAASSLEDTILRDAASVFLTYGLTF
jgi:hypothetical protein